MCKRNFSWESVPSLFEAAEAGILKYHNFTGLPWWGTLASSTIAVRLALFPLVRLQMLNTSEFVKVVPYFRMLRGLLTRRMLLFKSTAAPGESPLPIFKAYFRGLLASVRHTKLNFGKFFMYPLLNMTLFVSFVIGIRRLVRSDTVKDMDTGGLYWFSNLTKKDPSFILPLTACFLTYLSLFLSFQRLQGKSKFFTAFQDFFSSVAILVLPVTSLQPAAIFCYWIPSSALAAAQSVLLRTPKVQAFLKLPNAPALAQEAVKKSNIRPPFDPVYFTLHASKKHLKHRPKHLSATNLLLY